MAGFFPSPQWEQSIASDFKQRKVELEWLYRLTQQQGREETLRHTLLCFLLASVSQPYTGSLSTPLSHQCSPSTKDIQWIDSFPGATRREAMRLAQCWAG